MHSGLKNAGAQTDAPGSGKPAVQATRTYDAFGATASSTGSWQGPFGYAGQFGYQEEASGLQLMGHRWYDASTGRFLTRDPAGHGSNWYTYCGNNPVSCADPDGPAKVWVAWRPVAGGFDHAIIIVKDEESGKIWVFEAGPNGSYPNTLVGEGRTIENGREYADVIGYDRELLVDDENSGKHWVDIFDGSIPSPVPYWPIDTVPITLVDPLIWPYSGNSNSWARELLERGGLPTRAPSRGRLPRWHSDPWDPR